MPAWIPIIPNDSPVSQGAWDAVDMIARSVAAKDYPPLTQSTRVHQTYEEPLLFGYLARTGGRQEWIDLAISELNNSVETASEFGGGIGLFGGLCGLGWVLEHVSALLEESPDSSIGRTGGADEDDEDLNEQTDLAVVSRLRGPARKGVYDLISGPVGWGVYFLERFPRGKSEEGIALIVRRLEEISERHNGRVTWFTPPELLPDWQREICRQGYYNLGVAHGIAGILHFLAEAQCVGVEKERAGALLNGGMEWFLAQRRPPGSSAWFSAWLAPGVEPSGSRPTWCYGDLGILAVLFQVARRTGREDWHTLALELLDHCLACPLERYGVNDAPLCHGAAGCAHIFNRIYQAEGDSRCREAALRWFDRVLAMRRPGSGVGGFSAFSMPEGDPVWEPSPAFLDGAMGVALALLAALTPVEPNWDRQLLVSAKK